MLRIRKVYPGSKYFPSRIQGQKDSRIPDPHPRILLTRKIVSTLSENPGSGSRGQKRHRIPDPQHWQKCSILTLSLGIRIRTYFLEMLDLDLSCLGYLYSWSATVPQIQTCHKVRHADAAITLGCLAQNCASSLRFFNSARSASRRSWDGPWIAPWDDSWDGPGARKSLIKRDMGRRRGGPLAPASRESSREGPSTVSTCFRTSHRMGLISDQISRNRKKSWANLAMVWVFGEKLTLKHISNTGTCHDIQEVPLVNKQHANQQKRIRSLRQCSGSESAGSVLNGLPRSGSRIASSGLRIRSRI